MNIGVIVESIPGRIQGQPRAVIPETYSGDIELLMRKEFGARHDDNYSEETPAHFKGSFPPGQTFQIIDVPEVGVEEKI